MQGQCKPNAIELARIAEVQPVLADFIGKGRAFFNAKHVFFRVIKAHYTPLYVQPFFAIRTIRTAYFLAQKKASRNQSARLKSV